MALALLQPTAAVAPGEGPRRAFVRVEGQSVYCRWPLSQANVNR
jgi:hypothetical protein